MRQKIIDNATLTINKKQAVTIDVTAGSNTSNTERTE